MLLVQWFDYLFIHLFHDADQLQMSYCTE